MKRFAQQVLWGWIPLAIGVFAVLYKPRSELPAWVDGVCVLYLFAMLLILPALQARERRES
jgi:hypothetical protein